MRANCDASRPVPEIPGMMPSPAVFEMPPSQYTPAASFSPMSSGHNDSYSLTALSMAAEYQALQGNMANGVSVHHSANTSSALPVGTINSVMEEPQTVASARSLLPVHGSNLEESLDNLASFLDNEPLNSYHFATMMSAEQPM
jgi:hypothetical protein